MSTPDEVLRRLREDDEHLAELAQLLIDHALDQPLHQLVDANFARDALCKGLQALAAAPDLEGWLQSRAEAAAEGADEIEGVLGEHIPITALAPLEGILRREFVADPKLVRALMDHASFRQLMRELLQANILEFARRAKDIVAGGAPKAASRGLGGMLGAVAKNVASVASSAVEKQLEDRARTFVEDAIGVAVETTIERFCDPKHAQEMATWRVDVLHAVLQLSAQDLIAERSKYPPEAFAHDTAALIRAFAGWSELPAEVDKALELFFDLHGEQSGRAWLEGSGLEQALRDDVSAQLVRQARLVVETPAFEGWMIKLLG